MNYPDLWGSLIGIGSILSLYLIWKHSEILGNGNVKGDPSPSVEPRKVTPVKTLKIDDKFSVVYNEEENSRPLYVERNGSRHMNFDADTPNWVRAMFYALLATEENRRLVVEANEKISELQTELSWVGETHTY